MDNTPLQVLLVEDNPGDAVLIQEFLRDARTLQTNVTWVQDLASAIAHLARGNFDLVLLDLSLPDSQGIETLRQVVAFTTAVTVVIMTGLDDEQLATRALSEGAQDYLVKGHIDAAMLERALRYATERARSEQALRQREAHFRSLLEHTSDVIVVKDQTGRTTYVSPSIEHVLGYHVEELVSTSGGMLIHPEDLAGFELYFARVCAEPWVHVAFSFRMRNNDGSWHYIGATTNNFLAIPGVHGV
ncbi:MAG: response regulator, partial [Dehalococcoidia bacterium]